MNPNNLVGSVSFNDLILWVLGLGSVIAIADFVGLLPPSVAKWLARNRLEATLQALRKLGVRACWNEATGTVSLVDRTLDAAGIKEPAYKQRLRDILAQNTFSGAVVIGGTRSFHSDAFIDVMGASTDHETVVELARILNTHCVLQGVSGFDVVATPKTGSPLLGYEFARLTGKGFCLGATNKVAEKGALGAHAVLDFPKAQSLSGKRVLLVDDSTTGGRKISELAKELRATGATVEEVLVLFEPSGKGARESLLQIGLKLHAITKGPEGRF